MLKLLKPFKSISLLVFCCLSIYASAQIFDRVYTTTGTSTVWNNESSWSCSNCGTGSKIPPSTHTLPIKIVVNHALSSTSTYTYNGNYIQLDLNQDLDIEKLAAQDLWAKIVDGTITIKRDYTGKITGKIDIVAHSMGYAYAQGMIDELKTHLSSTTTFGRFYILAPENACSATTFNKNLFDEVWQYGSDEREMSVNPWQLDGIAPQCAVPGLDWSPATGTKYGRIPIPKADPNRNFLGAHYGASYEWIFTTINSGESGYVVKR